MTSAGTSGCRVVGHRLLRIGRVYASGDAATASATLVHGATTFTDYFVQLKMNNESKISNKVYARRPTK